MIIFVPDEIFCTLTRKSVPWRENMYLDKKIRTLMRNSVPDEKIWATDVHVQTLKNTLVFNKNDVG